ncbi:MAG: hypothetical protein PHE27_00870 [Alphaproteobacteria bacterium]|nr:hypothetical protein [Alphaproteobacteria bacterium]
MTIGKCYGLCALAFLASLSMSACAQDPQGNNMPPRMGAGRGMMSDELRVEFHDELARLRVTQEEINTASEALLDKCIDPPREKVTGCKAQRKKLRQRADKLAADKKALEDRMESIRERNRMHQMNLRPAGTMRRMGRPMAPESQAGDQ